MNASLKFAILNWKQIPAVCSGSRAVVFFLFFSLAIAFASFETILFNAPCNYFTLACCYFRLDLRVITIRPSNGTWSQSLSIKVTRRVEIFLLIFLLPFHKGTEVPSLSRDIGTTEQAQTLAMRQDRPGKSRMGRRLGYSLFFCQNLGRNVGQNGSGQSLFFSYNFLI